VCRIPSRRSPTSLRRNRRRRREPGRQEFTRPLHAWMPLSGWMKAALPPPPGGVAEGGCGPEAHPPRALGPPSPSPRRAMATQRHDAADFPAHRPGYPVRTRLRGRRGPGPGNASAVASLEVPPGTERRDGVVDLDRGGRVRWPVVTPEERAADR